LIDATNFTDSILIQADSDGSAPTTGTLNAADGNVGIGKDVLKAITSADANVIIGKNAGPAITSGGFNVILGENAGSQISTGHSNIAIGRGANRFGNGTDNISLGSFSMMNGDLTGIQNICIGYSAGNNITTGDYNVVLGNADVASATGNHQLSISSNDAVSPVTWITGDSSGVVNIPGSLTVAGSAVGGASAIDGLSDAITTATSNIGLGSGALDSLTASNGNYNVALGINAGTAITTGDRNISIGFGAGDGYDTENDNIAIGYDALGGAIAGAEKNVAIGNYSGDALTSGDYNVFVGDKAGTGVTTGQGNVIVGQQEYTSSTMTGSFNVHVGHRAGESTTDGTYNTFVGSSAANGISSGDYNTVLGESALSRANTQHGNVALGYKAGTRTRGDNNIFIGRESALQSGTDATGDNNIFLGYTAGNNMTSGSNNLVIGAADADTATGDDQISISSGDGGVTWIKGDSNGIKALKIKVKPVTGNTTLTDAQSGSYVYWTAGTLTLPATAESGQQYTIINNTGGSATPSLGTSNAIASGWTSHAAMSDETARTYVAVATNTWIYIG